MILEDLSAAQHEMETYPLKIMNKTLTIPWSGVEKSMLLVQNGLGPDAFIEDQTAILKIQDNTSRRMNDLYKVLSELPNNSTIVDIGAGNGLTDLSIHLLFSHKNFKFILVDSDNTYPSIVKNYKFYDEGSYKLYNNWSFVNKTIVENNFPLENFITKSPEDSWADTPVDLIMSIASWGWHYPIEAYLDKSFNLLKTDGFIYIDPLLNINQSFDKISTRCRNIILKRSIQHQPAFSKSEDRRKSSVIEKNNLSKDIFSFHFLGQK